MKTFSISNKLGSRPSPHLVRKSSIVPGAAMANGLPSFRGGRSSGSRLGAAPLRPSAPSTRVGSSVVTAAACKVNIEIKKHVSFGDTLKVVGSTGNMGSWKVDKAPALQWTEGDLWRTTLEVEAGSSVEFKFVVLKGKGGESWEEGDNRKYKAEAGVQSARLACVWGAGSEMKPEVQQRSDGAPIPAPAPAPTPAPIPAAAAAAAAPSNPPPIPPPPPAPRSLNELSMDAASGAATGAESVADQWKGKKIEFMRSNNHTKERRGVWETTGLEGAALVVVEGDRESGSWLQKLKFLKELLARPSFDLPNLDTLAAAAIYLSWISTGAVECIEGGGHYRPNHHAEMSKLIFRSMEWVIGHAKSDVRMRMCARLVTSRLPSFSEEFTATVPLTRIRDLAHRSDIPSDVKQEIKHTLQNKLHRNAGPEDLVAAEQMLQKLTDLNRQGKVNDGFLRDFHVFMEELRDFFGAASLGRLLEQCKPALDSGSGALIDTFLAAKGRLDRNEGGQSKLLQSLIDALHALTSVRALAASALASGLRNDAPDSAMVMRYKFRLAEIRSQEYAFVLLSRIVNEMERMGGAEGFAKASDGTWSLPMGAVVLGIRNMGIAGVDAAEAMALEQELASWQKQGKIVASKENALRMKASLERALRLTGGYGDTVLDCFAGRAATMGRAMGIDYDRYAVFAESEIRSSVAFQVSRACELLLRAARAAAGVSPWDVVVPGASEGILVEVDSIDPEVTRKLQEDVVLVARRATGDEEVSTLGPRVKALVLRQALPHLSHLGVRARQEKMTFATVEDDRVYSDAIKPLLGRRVRLEATAGGGCTITSNAAAAAATPSGGKAAAPVKVTAPFAAKPKTVPAASAAAKAAIAQWAAPSPAAATPAALALPLQDASVDTCGSKAATCSQLAKLALAADAAAAFRTPRGCAVTYAALQDTLHANGKKKVTDFTALLEKLEAAQPTTADAAAGALEAACAEMQELILSLQVPKELLAAVLAFLQPSAGIPLICRSSANVEDLEGLSGAGLYDSIGNVDPTPEAVALGLKRVWASLYTRRAVASRAAAGVGQASARMGVLVQEMASADVSFVLHTRHPTTGDDGVLVAELAVGLGETLASGTRGTPWRLEVTKGTGAVNVTSFSNLGQAFTNVRNGGTRREDGAESGAYAVVTVDHSQQALSVDGDVRRSLGQRLGAIGTMFQKEFGTAQDIEGCLVGKEIVIVQSRPQ